MHHTPEKAAGQPAEFGFATDGDDPAVLEFEALVNARKAGDFRRGKKHVALLLALGWRVMPVEPRAGTGGRR